MQIQSRRKSGRIACHKLLWFYQIFLEMSKKRGKGLLNKAESIKEFATHTSIKYATCMDSLLEGEILKPGEIDNLCCSDDYEAVTDFYIYALFSRVSKYKSDEYMCKWLSFFTIQYKQTLHAKAGQYFKIELRLDTWVEVVKLGRRADILSVFALSALISKHTLIHLRNGNIWTTMETSNMDHDNILKDCDIHLAYLGNGLFSEMKWKKRDCDFAQEPRTCKLANITVRVKPTSSAESMSKVTSEYVQTHNILTGTMNIKCENTGTTSTTVIKSSTHRTGDISSTCGTADIFAGTPAKIVNIDPDIELVGTIILDKTTVTDDFSLDTTERVIGSIYADASMLQLLVSENTRLKGADASCSLRSNHTIHLSDTPFAIR